jgi:hypothetical protein
MPGDVTTAIESVENAQQASAAAPKARTAPRGVWLLPSFTDLAMLLPFLLLFTRLNGFSYLIGDGSTGWHIRTGEWILEHGRVPTQDIFSFTMAGRPWFAWEWLWDVAFASLHRLGGLNAIVMASMAVISATFGLLYRLVRRRCENMVIAIAATALAIMVSTVHWLARPHLFTILFTAVFLWVLDRAREGRLCELIVLPVLTVFWTNLHGGFFVGIMLVLTYAAGEILGGLVAAEPEARRAGVLRSKPYVITAAACLLASLVNPQFYKLHVHIFRFLASEYQNPNMMEFMPFDFHLPVARYFEPMLACGILAAGWNAWRGRWTQAILVAIWAHLALLSGRNLPLFALVAAPAAAEMLDELVRLARESRSAAWIRNRARALEELGREYAAMDGAGRLPILGTLGTAALILLVYLPIHSPLLRAEYDPHKFPVAAASVLNSRDRVFTTDVWAGYLIYRFYPSQRVFIDDRSDFYGAEFCSRYLKLMRGNYDWQQTLARYRIDTVLLPAGEPLVAALKESARWRPVYDDGVAIVFRLQNRQVSAGVVGGVFPVVARSRNTGSVIPGSPSTLMRGDALNETAE